MQDTDAETQLQEKLADKLRNATALEGFLAGAGAKVQIEKDPTVTIVGMQRAFKENKMFAFGCVWMANNVAAGMVATGAFEIVVGDRTIYSKLETGRLPNAKDVIDGLKRVGLTTPLEAKYLGTAPRSEL